MSKSLRIFTLSGLLLVTLPGFSTAQAAVFVNGTGACLDDKFELTNNFNPVQAFSCNLTFAQQWNFEGLTIQGVGTTGLGGKCVDVNGAGTAAGTVVQLFQCNGSVAQQWEYINGFLFNPHSGKCLDVFNGANFVQARIEPCAFSNGQRWSIRSRASLVAACCRKDQDR